jgi:probable addiction module antidote protein
MDLNTKPGTYFVGVPYRLFCTSLFGTGNFGDVKPVREGVTELRSQGLEGNTMTEKFTRWDPADHLAREEDMALYLDACLDEDPGDGSVVRAALMDIARARGMSQLARDSGITREGLYKALSASGNPEFSTVLKVIKALKIRLHATPVGDVRTRKGARKKSSGELAAV